MNYNISDNSNRNFWAYFKFNTSESKRYKYFSKLCIHFGIFFIQILSSLLSNSTANYYLILETIYCHIESKSTFKTSPCGMPFTKKEKEKTRFPVLVFAKEAMNRKSALEQEVWQGLQQSLNPSMSLESSDISCQPSSSPPLWVISSEPCRALQ